MSLTKTRKSRALLPDLLPGALIATALLVPVGASFAQEPKLEQRVQRLERLLESQSLLDMFSRMEALQQDVRQLRGQVEEQNHALSALKQRQRDLYLDMDRRMRQLEVGGVSAPGAGAGMAPGTAPGTPASGAGTATPATGTSPTPVGQAGTPSGAPTETTAPSVAAQPTDTAAEHTAYREAFNLLKEGRFDDAKGKFASFLQSYPQSGYADNAQYWLGEANYVTKEYTTAVAEFEKVLTSYPASPKVADAMLKIGFCWYELQDYAQARAMLSKVITAHPKSTAARLAENRLQLMKIEGN